MYDTQRQQVITSVLRGYEPIDSWLDEDTPFISHGTNVYRSRSIQPYDPYRLPTVSEESEHLAEPGRSPKWLRTPLKAGLAVLAVVAIATCGTIYTDIARPIKGDEPLHSVLTMDAPLATLSNKGKRHVPFPLGQRPSITNCSQFWFSQPVDHFNWKSRHEGNRTFDQRYVVYDKYWAKTEEGRGPIFFYAGNEADVSLYVNNTGLMWENAKEFGALLLFAEHRYYGSSQPVRPPSLSAEALQYLTHEQALADYANLLYHFKKEENAETSPVIVFGALTSFGLGSYGGMLAAWFRMKYPAAVAGAISASAPLLAFEGASPPFDTSTYWEVVTRDASPAAGSATHCAPNVRKAWPIIFERAKTDEGRKSLRQLFHLCEALEIEEDGIRLAEYIMTAFDSMAMGNFPYPSSYMTSGNGELPAWPVRAACSHLDIDFDASAVKVKGNQDQLLDALSRAAGVYNNASGTSECYSLPSEEDLNGGIWDYHFCTEMLPQESYFASNGQSDMFWPRAYDIEKIRKHCKQQFDLEPRPEWIHVSYGDKLFRGVSNILLSNGLLDPWSSAGVLESPSESVISVVIPEGAHHLDLFFSHPDDPESVVLARETEKRYIKRWIDQAMTST